VGVRPRGANADDAVLAPIRLLNEGLLRAMKAGQAASFSDRFNILAPIIDQTFDLTTILKDSVGLEWQSLPPGQQATLLDAFRRYTVASYVNSFDSYDGQRLLVNPETRAVGADQVVRSQIIPRTGQGHTLDYVMRRLRRVGHCRRTGGRSYQSGGGAAIRFPSIDQKGRSACLGRPP